MRRIGMAVLGLSIIAGSTPLFGQREALREMRERGSVGFNLVVAQPLGDFRRNGDVAAGLNAFAVTSGGFFGLRVEGSWMIYDNSYQGYGVSTTSQIGTLAIGPQIMLGGGPVRLYGFGTMGGSLFYSSAHGCGCYHSDSYLDGDFTTTKSAGAGVLVAVSRQRTPIDIDLGVRDVRHDRVKYIPAGGLSQNPDGTFSASEVETPVEMRVFQVGVRIGLR